MNLDVYKRHFIDDLLGRNFEFNHINTLNEKPSLPCPVDGYVCGTFSRIFDKYLPKTRNKMLVHSRAINKNNNIISWQWDDWHIDKKSSKISMKRAISLHFSKFMYIIQNPESKLLRQDLKHLVKVHTIDMIPIL